MLLISCPYCGERPEEEFAFGGDASVVPPNGAGEGAPVGTETFADYLYLRDNPKGRHREHWIHRYGCQRWIEVERDTVTHEIYAVRAAGEGK